MKILAIDDSRVNLLLMKGIIVHHLPDALLKTVRSGIEGLEIARSWHPDTILLDLQMPDMDGYETIRRLKNDPETSNIPVIMITATNVVSKDRVKGLEMGADAFLEKPISPHELVAHIKVMLRIKKAEDRQRYSQKLEAIGLLAGGVAHDFNNILTVITGYSTMLLMQAKPEEPQYESLQMIVDAANRATRLTQSLLTFSRKQEMTPLNDKLCTLVSHFEKFIKNIVGEKIKLNFLCDQYSKSVTIDLGMIEQMLMNLAINARDAMPEGGQLTISTTTENIDDEKARFLAVTPGTYMCITVIDTGCGISKELLPKIFDPFFTTKDVGKGSGLGLSVVYGIVEQHRGVINVDSTPGVGTVFTVYLPIDNAEQQDLDKR